MISSEELDKIEVNFIIGPGRSGTTLLVMLLNEIEGCVASPEIKHVIYFYKSFKNIHSVDNKTITAYKNYLFAYKKASNNPLYQFCDTLPSDLFSDKIKNYANLSKAFHLQLHSHKLKKISTVFDKNNFYSFFVKELKIIYPNAKFCVMIRDPRAFVASNLQSQHTFKDNKNTAYYAFVWRSYLKKIKEVRREFKDDIFLLKYEDLVSNKEGQMKMFCSFFGLNYSHKIFDFRLRLAQDMSEALINNQINKRMAKKIEDLTKPISNSQVASWENKLSKEQQSIIQQITDSEARHFGYASGEKPSFLSRVLIHLRYLRSWLRVVVFFNLKSIKLHHYLNISKRASFNEKMSNMNA
jgi:hypothetical protein